MKKTHFCILLTICLALAATAQDTLPSPLLPHYQFRLDSTTLMLGDQTILYIEPATTYPSLEELSANNIVAVRQWVDSASGSFCTALTSFEEGEHWLHIGSDSVLLTVKDVPNVDTTNTDIKDISNILRQPYTFGEIAKCVGIVLGICALIAVIIFVIIRSKNHKPIINIPRTPPLPPDTRALNALEELRQQQLWQRGEVKEYQTQLTDILRDYLEEAFLIQSSEMTSDQTLDAFRASKASTDEAADMLQKILQTADMVKFAKSQPLPHQHDFSMTQAVGFVNITASKHEVAEAGTAQPNPNT